MRVHRAKAVRRDLRAKPAKRDDLKYLNAANSVIYNNDYPPDAFVNWGQETITPFDYPYGTDSTKPFGDLN